jgi:hypothetical protein
MALTLAILVFSLVVLVAGCGGHALSCEGEFLGVSETVASKAAPIHRIA